MNTLNNQYKKYHQKSLNENIICYIAGLFCFCVLLFALFFLQPYATKVLEYLNNEMQVMNNVMRGGFQ